MSESSPKWSPSPSTPRMTSRPSSPMRTTLQRPERITYSESPGSFSKRMTLPFGKVFSRDRSANCWTSPRSRPLKSGTVARKSAVEVVKEMWWKRRAWGSVVDHRVYGREVSPGTGECQTLNPLSGCLLRRPPPILISCSRLPPERGPTNESRYPSAVPYRHREVRLRQHVPDALDDCGDPY